MNECDHDKTTDFVYFCLKLFSVTYILRAVFTQKIFGYFNLAFNTLTGLYGLGL